MDESESTGQQTGEKWSLWKSAYFFYGRYAAMAKKLEDYKYFNDKSSIFVCAPLIGFIYNRKGNKDEDTREQVTPVKIDAGTLEARKEIIMTIYRLIVLSDLDNEPDLDMRIEKAFRNISIEMTDESRKDNELFREYLYGGIEVLYEKLIGEDLSDNRKNTKDIIDEIKGFGLLIDALSSFGQKTTDAEAEKLI